MITLTPRFPPVVSAYMQSDARVRLILGPFGSGKSVGSQVDIPRRAAAQEKGPDGLRKTRFAVIRNTRPQLRDTTIKTWLEWFPNGSLGTYQSTANTYFIKQGDIECEVVFRPLDDANDVRNLLSAEYTGAYMNEFRDIPREIMEALDGRVGRYPRTIEATATTPAYGPTWEGIWGDSNYPEEGSYWQCMCEGLDPDDPKKKKENGWEIFKQPSGMIKVGSNQYIPNPAAENIANLPRGYYENLVLGKTEDYIRTYVMCEYGRSKGGLPVHPEFDRRIHVAKQSLIPSRELVLLICADFGMTPALALKQQDAFGRVLTLDDIACFDMGLERAIETKLLPLLKKKYNGGAKNGAYEIIVTGDPSGESRAQGDETTCVEIFREYKKYLGKVKMASTNAPVARRGGTDHFLIKKTPPTYLVDPGCDATIAALGGGFMFKKHKDGRHSEEVEKNDHSHIGEANEYGDLYFHEGRRRKAEQRADQMDWAQLHRGQAQSGSAYNTPR